MGGGSRGPTKRWCRPGVAWGAWGHHFIMVKPGAQPLTPLGWLAEVQAGAQQAGARQAGAWGAIEPQVFLTGTSGSLSKGLPLELALC